MSETPSELRRWVRAYLEQDEDIIVPMKKMWNEWYAAQGTPMLAEFTRMVLSDDLVEEMPGVDHTGHMEGMGPEEREEHERDTPVRASSSSRGKSRGSISPGC